MEVNLRPGWSEPSPTKRVLGHRNYHSRESHNVRPTTNWWGGGKSMKKWLNQCQLSRVVNAFGELTTERYLAFGTSFKRILRRHDGFLGIWQKWRCMRIGETILISIPLKRDYIRKGKADKGVGWKKTRKTRKKIRKIVETERRGVSKEGRRRTTRGWGM